ncbi:hypothetical protein [Microseira wollei]|uniref:Uncharacterized protein n=1 Tax=Microseira wollei NIES-4236 TaxID=2530354 RepID=A0AAV3XHK6_9CYAN|nr:hypothetical protein [Microseira wollei]GET38967.1 hypothetical protein MiSe_37270 [Microseira wollei NIES-4236]
MLESKIHPTKQTQPILESFWQALLWLWRAWSKTLTPKAGTKRQVALREQVAYSVVHAIPGRVRFRVSKLVRDAEYAHRLQMLADSDSNITGVRINRNAASVAFNYHRLEISDLVSLIQSAGKYIEKDWLSQRPKGETVQWRDGEIFSVSYQNHTHPEGWGYTNEARRRGLENGGDRCPHPEGWGYTGEARWRGLENEGEILPGLVISGDTQSSEQNLLEPIAKLIILACSLEVRKAEIPSSCCLLKSQTGKPLYGGAKASRIVKLRKLHVLI